MFSLAIEAFLPINTFTFRPYESLLYKHSGVGMPFYPNQKLEMISMGDLCSYSQFSVPKHETWITDEIGFRNNKLIKGPDVLLIGDSFLFGMGLTQDSTLTNILNSEFQESTKFYNLAPASMSDFVVLYENGIIDKPKLIICVIGEDILSSLPQIEFEDYLYKDSRLSQWINKASRLYSLKFVTSRYFGRNVKGIKSKVDENMYFFPNSIMIKNRNDAALDAEVIQSYKDYCAALEIEFMFVPVPNKSTVYYDLVPLAEQPDYLFYLESEMNRKNTVSINTLDLFNQYRKEHDSLLYHTDDTHWNSLGVSILAKSIKKKILFFKSNSTFS